MKSKSNIRAWEKCLRGRTGRTKAPQRPRLNEGQRLNPPWGQRDRDGGMKEADFLILKEPLSRVLLIVCSGTPRQKWKPRHWDHLLGSQVFSAWSWMAKWIRPSHSHTRPEGNVIWHNYASEEVPLLELNPLNVVVHEGIELWQRAGPLCLAFMNVLTLDTFHFYGYLTRVGLARCDLVLAWWIAHCTATRWTTKCACKFWVGIDVKCHESDRTWHIIATFSK